MDIEIQTYWNVETLYYVFNAVGALMGSAGFEGLLKLVLLFGVAVGMFGYMSNQLEMAKWFIQALVFISIMNLPIARVALTDKTGLEPPRVVDNVPFALAVVAQTTNLVFGSMASAYETAFGVPEELGLQKGDVGFGHRILKQVGNATVRDPGLRADLMQFFKECTVYDVKDGVISANDLTGSVGTWDLVFDNTSPARFVTYDTLTGSPTTDTCTATALVLKPRVTAAVTAAQTYYGKQVFTRAQSDAIATQMYVAAIGTSYDWILKNASNASDAMKQSMFNNVWREAGTELPALLNDQARVAEVSALTGAAQAAKQADGSNSTLSLLAQETLPHMRNWIEAIIYSLFPVILVLMVVSSTEGAKKILMGYMMSLVWIGLWPLLFAVINHLSLMHLSYKSRALDLAANGVPFQVSDVFDATLGNEQAAIGYMVVLVPFIAGAIVRMGQGGFMGIADKMMTGFASSGQALGASAASGNVSMGQAGMDTRSVNTTTMNKYDSNLGMTGVDSMRLGSGDIASTSANGTVTSQAFRSSLLTQLTQDNKAEVGSGNDASSTLTAGTGSQVALRNSTAASLTQVQGTEATRGKTQNKGEVVTDSKEGFTNGDYRNGLALEQTTAAGSNFQLSSGAFANVTGTAGAGLQLGNRGGGSPSGGLNPKNIQRIENGIAGAGGTKGQVDAAVQQYNNTTGQGGSSPGLRAGFDLGASYQGGKAYSAAHGNEKSTRDAVTEGEQAGQGGGYTNRGSLVAQQGNMEQSAQNNKAVKEAALTKANDLSNVTDASSRNENAVVQRASKSQSNAVALHRDLLADPLTLKQIAEANGMSVQRFMGQSTTEQMRMTTEWGNRMLVNQKSTPLPSQTNDGAALPTTGSALNAKAEIEKAAIRPDIAGIHKQDVSKTGFKGVAPVKVDTSVPKIVTDAQKEVQSRVDPGASGGIRQQGAKLKENVNAWASPDKQVGQGRANEGSVVDQIMVNDAKDTVSKVWNVIKGGDATADGEKLTPTQKEQVAPRLDIGKKQP